MTEDVLPLSAAQLGAYLARVGLPRPPIVDFEALAAIHRAHLLCFTWEASDAFMGWPSSLRPKDAFAKMVTGKRGGWCYEMNGLLGAALSALGFPVTRLRGAVNRVARGDTAIGNHLTLRVDLDQPYLADVGLGDAIMQPVPLKLGPIRQRGFDFAIAATDDGWLRFQNHAQGLAPYFDFHADRSDESAMVAAHRWLTEDPASPLTSNLVFSRHTPEGFVALQNDRLRWITSVGSSEERITSAGQLVDTLNEVFAVEVPQPGLVWDKVQVSLARRKAD